MCDNYEVGFAVLLYEQHPLKSYVFHVCKIVYLSCGAYAFINVQIQCNMLKDCRILKISQGKFCSIHAHCLESSSLQQRFWQGWDNSFENITCKTNNSLKVYIDPIYMKLHQKRNAWNVTKSYWIDYILANKEYH